MMNFRGHGIGFRLIAGFGSILLLTAALVVGGQWQQHRTRAQLAATLDAASHRIDLARSVQESLLECAVAVRSMALQTDVDGIARKQAEAELHQRAFVNALATLRTSGLSEESADRLKSLGALNQQVQADFKEALDLALQFNAEQAARVVTTRIDPNLQRIVELLKQVTRIEGAAADRSRAEVEDSANRLEVSAMAATSVVLVLAALFCWRLTLSITKPIDDAQRAATCASEGDFGFAVDTQGGDEPAQLLRALDRMRDNLSVLVRRVRENSESVAVASTQIAQGNADLSIRTERQASSLQETNATMDQLTSAVQRNAENAKLAHQLSQGAADVAKEGGLAVQQVVDTMRGIQQSARRISEIIGAIDGIAFQTNILALNAAVEAARAGEQGRGFAVVAGEVRALAQRSATAAREIKDLIADSVERIEQGSTLVDSAGATMRDIVQSVQHVAVIVGEINVASGEQSVGLGQVRSAVAAIEGASQQNAALVEESAASAESLRMQSDELVGAVSIFRLA